MNNSLVTKKSSDIEFCLVVLSTYLEHCVMQLSSTWSSAFHPWPLFMKGTMDNMYTGQWSVASLELTDVTEVIDGLHPGQKSL